MNRKIVRDLIDTGRFVTVEFYKADGTLRKLNGRTGVTKHLRGGTKTVNDKQYLTIYDIVAEGYRNVAVDRIVSINGDKLNLNKRGK